MIPSALILITRPEEQARLFATKLQQALDHPADILVAPVTKMTPLGPIKLRSEDRIILTSANALRGVEQGSISGQTAYCVGEATAIAARSAGFRTIVAEGTADSLIQRILKDWPKAPMVYLRGRDISVDVADRLAAKGISVRQHITYHQDQAAIKKDAMARILGAKHLIIPLFSINSADYLFSQLPKTAANTHVVAISAAVADVAKHAGYDDTLVADHPEGQSMVRKVKEVLMSIEGDAPPEQPPLPAQTRKTGQGAPALLGGIGAAVVGFILAQLVPNGWPISNNTARLDTIEGRAVTVEAQVSDMHTALSDLAENIAEERETQAMALEAIADDISEQAAQTTVLLEAYDELQGRLTALERRPVGGGSASDAAIQSYGRELADLRAAVENLQTDIERLQSSPDASDTAKQELAWIELEAAVNSGAGFSEELARVAELSGMAAPEELTAAAAGVTPISDLASDFPEAARAVLFQTRLRDEDSPEGGGIGGFIQRQLGVRSLSPREGTDVDAILSRVEAALISGDLSAAFQELSALDGDARSALGAWGENFQERISVSQSLKTYGEAIRKGQE